MSEDAWPIRSSEADDYVTRVRFVGGTAAVTELFGRGVTVTYVSTGLVDLVWSEFPGLYIGLDGWGFDATTASAVAGYSCNAGAYNSTTRTLRVSIYNGSNTLADLAALQNLTLGVAFKRSGTGV
jgi:hypothetical protein